MEFWTIAGYVGDGLLCGAIVSVFVGCVIVAGDRIQTRIERAQHLPKSKPESQPWTNVFLSSDPVSPKLVDREKLGW